MKIGVPTETHPDERRVAATPDTVERLKKMGFAVAVQAGAGEEAGFTDDVYAAAGAEIAPDAAAIWSSVDLVLKIRPPTDDEADALREEGSLISFLWPAQNAALVQRLAARKATVLAMDCIPRITRAQKMDALSSMANIAGYRAVVEAASHFGSFFTQQITAAGKIAPAKVLVIGAGVAGLAALGAARGLGAMVRAFDTRAAAREQVQSLGAEFLEVELEENGEGGGGYAKVMSPAFIEAEMALFRAQAREVDIVITTALIPGKPAPKLWDAGMVEAMKPGSVVVDLAASQGGNCELTVPGEVVVRHGVTLVGYEDLTSRMARTASQLYGTNQCHLLDDMGGGEGYHVDLEDEAVRGALVLHHGELMWPPPKAEPAPTPPAAEKKPGAPPPAAAAPAPVARPPAKPAPRKGWVAQTLAVIGLGAWLWAMLTQKGDASLETAIFLQHLTVFVLACFVGWQVIWNVTPALHTPLMSVTNAISGIIIVGGMLQARGDPFSAAALLGAGAIFLASINIFGGFLVTQRMLRMFRK